MKPSQATREKGTEQLTGSERRRTRVRLHDGEHKVRRYRVRLDECNVAVRRERKRINFGTPIPAEQLLAANLLPEQTYMNTEQAAWYLGLSPKTLQNWRVSGKGPKCEFFGTTARRYLFAELQRWAANSKKAPE